MGGNRYQERGKQLDDLGKRITGVVWSVFFLVIIAVILWNQVS